MHKMETAARQQEVAENGDCESVITRMSNIPIVHSAVDQVQNVYQKAKEAHPYVKSTLEVAEKTVTVAAETAKPYVDKIEAPLSTVNVYANKGLDKLEEKVPIITKPTDEVYENTLKPGVDYVKHAAQSGKDTVYSTKDYGVKKIHDTAEYGKGVLGDAKDYTVQQVSTVLQTSYGQALLKGVDNILSKTEEYVDYYLPVEEKENGGSGDAAETKPATEAALQVTGPGNDQVQRVGNLSNKVRKRLYVQAIKQMQHLQLRTTDTAQRMHFTVDLIEYARHNLGSANQKVRSSLTVAQQKVRDTWQELNTAPPLSPDGESGEVNGEATVTDSQMLIVAQNLTTLLSRVYHTAYTASYSFLPANLQNSLENGKKTADDLYTSFSKITHISELSQAALDETRTSLEHLQQSVHHLVDNVVDSKALAWLVPEYNVAEIDLGGEALDSDQLEISLENLGVEVEQNENNLNRHNENNLANEGAEERNQNEVNENNVSDEGERVGNLLDEHNYHVQGGDVD